MGRTYSDAVTAGTPMKGSHVRILRGYIEDDLDNASVDFDWSWSNWSAAQDSTINVRAIYFKEMRDAIQELWDSKGRGALPDWTQEEPRGASTGHQNPTHVRATHVTDLRRWLNQYEDNHPPMTQGIDSRSYDPLAFDGPVISDVDPNDWSSDVKGLSDEDRPLSVRLKITGRRDPDHDDYTTDFIGPNPSTGHPGDLAIYHLAFSEYANQDMDMYPVFTDQLYNPYPQQSHSSTAYRLAFADRIKNFVTNIYDDEYDDGYTIRFGGIIIWNEPNEGNMSPDDFVRLVYTCWKSFKEDPRFFDDMPRIYLGGIFISIEGYESGLIYLENCFTFLQSSGLMAGENVAFPWNGINIHIHRSRTDTEVRDILSTAKQTQISFGDSGEMIIGEWGVHMLEDTPDDLTALYDQIKQDNYAQPFWPDLMFYLSHHNIADPGGIWGLRWSTNFTIPFQYPNGFTLNSYRLDQYGSSTANPKAKSLRNRYASIMDGTPI